MRTAGQPATFSTGSAEVKAGSTGDLYVPLWAPASSVSASAKWSIFRTGDLIADIGRLIVDNSALIGAKRHCIALPTSGEVRITRSKVGVSQGCGVFSDGAGDGAIANCWFMETGGANIYTYNATDFRFGQCLIEGGGVSNVYSEWGQVKIANCDLWGGRAGNIVAMKSGWIRDRHPTSRSRYRWSRRGAWQHELASANAATGYRVSLRRQQRWRRAHRRCSRLRVGRHAVRSHRTRS